MASLQDKDNNQGQVMIDVQTTSIKDDPAVEARVWEQMREEERERQHEKQRQEQEKQKEAQNRAEDKQEQSGSNRMEDVQRQMEPGRMEDAQMQSVRGNAVDIQEQSGPGHMVDVQTTSIKGDPSVEERVWQQMRESERERQRQDQGGGKESRNHAEDKQEQANSVREEDVHKQMASGKAEDVQTQLSPKQAKDEQSQVKPDRAEDKHGQLNQIKSPANMESGQQQANSGSKIVQNQVNQNKMTNFPTNTAQTSPSAENSIQIQKAGQSPQHGSGSLKTLKANSKPSRGIMQASQNMPGPTSAKAPSLSSVLSQVGGKIAGLAGKGISKGVNEVVDISKKQVEQMAGGVNPTANAQKGQQSMERG